ncbi:MAG: BlaI/MecI/CopY family transcriptional regulator [Planctomycetes bacterium]|nr:BlaI/MecI/CopY family transcriptional regulator [Planctomycetota bacterium]
MTAKKILTPLSPAETEILRLVWQLNGPTVQQVCDTLPTGRQITYATVQTMLRRLEKKGYLRHESRGKAHVFIPAVRKDQVLGSAVRSFLDKLFGGNAVPLVQYLAENKHITADDVEQLKTLLNEPHSKK